MEPQNVQGINRQLPNAVKDQGNLTSPRPPMSSRAGKNSRLKRTCMRSEPQERKIETCPLLPDLEDGITFEPPPGDVLSPPGSASKKFQSRPVRGTRSWKRHD